MSIHDDMSDVSTSRIDYVVGKDDKYWDKRRRNNAAAKKSRDARRIRENQVKTGDIVSLKLDFNLKHIIF